MKDSNLIIIQNIPLTSDVFQMKLGGDISSVKNPGEFVNIKIDGFYLRRPISVCDKTDEVLTLVYKAVGKGTEKMANMSSGDTLMTLTGLGNGYDLSCAGDKPLLIGGGVGVPPMYYLAKKLREQDKEVTVILGFNSIDDVFYKKEFEDLGCKTIVTTVDGTYGTPGFVTDVLPDDYSYFYTCGPEPMLKALYEKTKTSGQFSFEERMGCGFGACMGCSCKTITGYKRICKDGPVLTKEEILWED